MTVEHTYALQNILEEMFARIATGDDITEQLISIEQLSVEIDATAPAMLKHYLQRKSYTKALDFIKVELIADHK